MMSDKIYRVLDRRGLRFLPVLPEYEQIILSDSPDFGIDSSGILNRLRIPFKNRWPNVIFLKLFIPFFCEDDYAVYMDVDTEIAGDISPLFSMRFKEPIAMSHGNGGVLVFNCREWKNRFTEQEIVDSINDYAEHATPLFGLHEEVVITRMIPDIFSLDDKYNRIGLNTDGAAVIHHAGTLCYG